MKLSTETEQLEQEIDQWFQELEEQVNKDGTLPPGYPARYDLDKKILDDFHGHAPTIDSTYDGQLPIITAKAQIFITENLEKGQYFRFAVEGGGCSGFNYLFDVTDSIESNDIQFSESPPAVIDDISLKYLYGSEIDLHTEGMNKMLKVTNPGAKASCGCGTSFAFDEDLLDMYP